MEIHIRPYMPEDQAAIIELTLRAWEPVFDSIRASMDGDLYDTFYPEGWRADQKNAVISVCDDENVHVWVAVADENVAGFTAVKLDDESKMGEIYMIATDPDYQKSGIGIALANYSVARMKEAGMTVAMVETGSDPGHAPARRTYEKAGFGLWPVSRYFKPL